MLCLGSGLSPGARRVIGAISGAPSALAAAMFSDDALRASSIPDRLRLFRDLLGCIDGRYPETFRRGPTFPADRQRTLPLHLAKRRREPGRSRLVRSDRKSTRLNSSHANISYAVFCLKKKT